jgi:hypothetical protein
MSGRLITASMWLHLGAALTLASASAPAADIPGSAATKATLPVSIERTQGRFEVKADRDWYKVSLRRGRNYAVSGIGCHKLTIKLRNASGSLIRQVSDSGGFIEIVGFEYRAKRTGTYFLEYKEALECETSSDHYFTGISGDCPGDKSTNCSATIPSVLRGSTAFDGEEDWFQVSLRGGQLYAFLTQEGCFRLVDMAGNNLGSDCSVGTFSVPQTGTYFLAIYNDHQVFTPFRYVISISETTESASR